jgi:LysR family transcriptional regulator, hydrogen peroxide-inducible genes activator
MEVRQLKYFVAVAEERSFSRAAARVRVAQPSLSQQIQKLEATVGQSLFDRLARRVTLTEAGHSLLPFARKILNGLSDAQSCLNDQAKEPSGSVVLGVIPTMAPFISGKLLAEAASEFPRLKIRLVEDVTDHLLRAVEDGEIDAAIISSCRKLPGIHLETIATEPLLAAVPIGHPFARQKSLRWEQLRKTAVLNLHESNCLSRQIRQACAQHQVRVNEELQLAQLSTLIAVMAAHQEIALVPAVARFWVRDRGCVLLPIRPLPPSRNINLLRHTARYQSKAVSSFCELIRRIVAQTVLSSAKQDLDCHARSASTR